MKYRFLPFALQSISPGLVRTELVKAEVYEPIIKLLSVEDVVKAFVFILDTPPNVLVSRYRY